MTVFLCVNLIDPFGGEDDDAGFGSGSGSESESGGGDGGLDGEEATGKRKRTRNEMSKRERLILKKRRLKEKFNADFDEKMKDKSGVGHDAHFEAMSHHAQRQTELNRLEFEKMDDSTRVEYEGFKAGMYVRVEIKGTNGILSNESTIQSILARHEYFPLPRHKHLEKSRCLLSCFYAIKKKFGKKLKNLKKKIFRKKIQTKKF